VAAAEALPVIDPLQSAGIKPAHCLLMPLSGRCLTPVWGDPTEEASDVVAEGLRARMSDLKRRLVPFPKSNSIEIDRAQGGAGCK
jgi:hypothetical protein